MTGMQCKKMIMIDEHIPKYQEKNVTTNWMNVTSQKKKKKTN